MGNSEITFITQQSADLACGVAMIDKKPPILLVCRSLACPIMGHLAADGTPASLLVGHGIVLSESDAVPMLKVGIPLSFIVAGWGTVSTGPPRFVVVGLAITLASCRLIAPFIVTGDTAPCATLRPIRSKQSPRLRSLSLTHLASLPRQTRKGGR